MRKIFLRDRNGVALYPDLVRYFIYQNDCYFIYTFHEVDERDFMKLYVVKVLEKEGIFTSKYIEDEFAWKKMSVIIKQLLKEIRNEQLVSFDDLDVSKIEGMQIVEAREFKLKSSLVNLLALSIDQNSQMRSEEQFTHKKDLQLPHQDKITLLQKLKQKECTLDNHKKGSNLEEIVVPLDVKEDVVEEVQEETIDLCSYQKLQEENALLKKMLLQYQVKYQTLKSLYAKD